MNKEIIPKCSIAVLKLDVYMECQIVQKSRGILQSQSTLTITRTTFNTNNGIQPNFNRQCQSRKNQGLTTINRTDSRDSKGYRIQAVKTSINKVINVVNKSYKARESPLRLGLNKNHTPCGSEPIKTQRYFFHPLLSAGNRC